jgi:DNA-binding transcriptional LysR family regulator
MSLPPISLRQLRAFAAVARLGSFRRAAEELNLSQPALSQAVRLLETETGARLLERNTRGVTLTEAGRQMLSTCESMLQSLEFTVASLRGNGAEETARLRIAALPSIARQIVVPAYRHFRAGSVTAALFIRDAVGEEVIRMIRAGEVDFGLTTLPRQSAELIVHPLLRSPMRVVVAQGHPFAATGATWRELAEERFIFVGRSSATYEITASAFRAAGRFPRHFIETQTAETAACMAAEGIGVTVLHARNLDEMAHYGFAQAPVRAPDCALEIALIRPMGRTLAPASLAFWEFLAQRNAPEAAPAPS